MHTRFKHWLLTACLALLMFLALPAQALVSLDLGQHNLEINRQVSVLHDPSGQHRVEQIVDKEFIPWQRPYLTFPASKGAIWLKIQILNRAPDHQSLRLLAQSRELRSLKIWAYQELTGLSELHRQQTNLNNIPMLGQGSYLTSVNLPPYSAGIYFLRIEPKQYTALNLRLLSTDIAIATISAEHWLSGVLLGLTLLLMITNLIRWRRLQLRSALLLTLLILFDFLAKISWPNLCDQTSVLIQLFCGRLNAGLLLLALATGLWFLRHHFQVKQHLPKQDPWLLLLSWLLCSIAVFSMSAPVSVPTLMLIPLILLVFLIAFGLSVWALPTQPQVAKPVIWGLIPIAIILLLAALQLLDLLSLAPYHSSWMMNYLSTLPWLILTCVKRSTQSAPEQNVTHTHNSEAAHTLAELIGRLGHDLKNPLTGIVGISQLLHSTQLSPKQQDFVATLLNSGSEVLHQINQLLDLSRLHAGQLQTEQVQFELEPLLNECIEQFARRAELQQIELASLLAANLPEVIETDPKRLLHILVSLLNQSFTPTQQNTVLLNVYLASRGASTQLCFSVQDTAPCIGQTQADALLHCPLDQLAEGDALSTRLGLTLSQQLATRLGGSLYYAPHGPHSEQISGNTFIFSLPLSEQWQKHQAAPSRDFSHLRTLVVDDNPTCCKVLAQQCRSLGMEVFEAHDGVQALALLRTHANLGEAFDLILLDYSMPNMNGLQLATRISQDSLLAEPLTQVMLTGFTQSIDLNSAQQAGISRVLSKPLPLHLLRNTLNELFAERLPELNPPEQTTPPRCEHSVLIVDDNPRNIEQLLKQLRLLGIEPDQASNGLTAIERATRCAYQLILMDCEMPILDGFEASRRIRQLEASNERKPSCIIALSAHMLEEHRIKAAEAGMDGELEKPVEAEVLEPLLQRLKLLSPTSRSEDV